ncbi:MAG TPA: 3-deoxy-8-phosphooctulonate synthase [candidate division Zixibacteria bacterium]|nr:3-deoxy-8-phosphooctulonate synthase [candidate division Zixibacteria bacterium]
MFELRRKAKEISVGKVILGGDRPWALIAGPCAIEGEKTAFETAECLRKVTSELNIPLIFKGSFDKANRTSITSPRGVGIDAGLRILDDIRAQLEIPVITDIHETAQAEAIAMAVDCIQIPAFLCRQTDLIVAASRTGKPVNIKKGQFLAPEDIEYSSKKAEEAGDGGIMLTERGTSFGYRDLVVDFRSIDIMSQTGWPIIMDVSHSQQKPGAGGGATAGSCHFIRHFAVAALALGVDGLFIETHPNPATAISDKETQWPLDKIRLLLEFLKSRFPE